jgi:hypothetical protein
MSQFDADALERAAKFARELEKSTHSREAIEISKREQNIKQAEISRDTERAKAENAKALVEQERVRWEEQRRTIEFNRQQQQVRTWACSRWGSWGARSAAADDDVACRRASELGGSDGARSHVVLRGHMRASATAWAGQRRAPCHTHFPTVYPRAVRMAPPSGPMCSCASNDTATDALRPHRFRSWRTTSVARPSRRCRWRTSWRASATPT